jgi:hypothetical protein
MESGEEDREFREEGEEENVEYIGSRGEEEKNEELDQRAQDMMRQMDDEGMEEGMDDGFVPRDLNEDGPEDERAGGGYADGNYDRREMEKIYQDYGRNEEENLSGRDEFGKEDRDYFEEDQEQYIENQSK